jgi:DNA-directed RNA polymerase subunit beta'
VRRLGKVRVTEEDCGAVEGIRIRRVAYHYAGAPFKRLLRGRVLVADVVDPYSSQVLARAGIPLDDAAATSLVSWPDEVEVRSPATCRARDGVCRLCMGPLDTRERHAGLAVALRVAHVARFMTRRAFHVGC